MDVYTTEAEQIELLKKWWKEYGWTIILAVVLALAGNFGWRYWRDRTDKEVWDASSKYEQLMANVEVGDKQTTERRANDLVEQHPGTPYAFLATLWLARQAVVHQKLDEAKLKLFWVMDNAKLPVLKQVARLRIARILLQEGSYEQAMLMLKELDDVAFKPAVLELQGDIYAALGKQGKARVRYVRAIDTMPERSLGHPLLKMKLENVAFSNPKRDSKVEQSS